MHQPYVTYSLVFLILLIFSVDYLNSPGTSITQFYSGLERFARFDEEWVLKKGELWRVFTYTFVHDDVVHLLQVGFSLLFLGSVLERYLGTGKFLVLYFSLAAGLPLGILFFWHIIFGDASMILQLSGARGNIWGLLGAAIWLLRNTPRGKVEKFDVDRKYVAIITFLIFLSLIAFQIIPLLRTWTNFFGPRRALLAAILPNSFAIASGYFLTFFLVITRRVSSEGST